MDLDPILDIGSKSRKGGILDVQVHWEHLIRVESGAHARTADAPASARTVAEEERAEKPLAARVSTYIRDSITEGQLKPGDRIRQEEIAHLVGTSRIPVREALRQLENEGLVTLIPHSGARVAVLDHQAFSEIYRMREVIEPMVIGESIGHLRDDEIERLRELMSTVDEASTEPVRWLQADREFHLGSMAAAPLPEMLDRVKGFWNQTQQYRRAYLEQVQVELEIVSAEHRLLMRAIEQRDAENAENLQRLHIRRTRVTLSPHLESLS